MPITLNGTAGVTYPDGVTQASGVPTASATSGAPLVSNGTIYTQNTPVGVAFGGTGATDAATARSNLGAGTGNGTVTSVGLTAGTAISISGGPITSSGSITVNNTGVTSLSAGSGISLSGSTGGVTISATGGGTVTSVATGNGLSGGTITSTGTLSIACPAFNTVGSYCGVKTGWSGFPGSPSYTAGTNYAAGNGNFQLQSVGTLDNPSFGHTAQISGTWKWMMGSYNFGELCTQYAMGIACRVS